MEGYWKGRMEEEEEEDGQEEEAAAAKADAVTKSASFSILWIEPLRERMGEG